MNLVQSSSIASIMIKPSCTYYGLGLQHRQDLYWTSMSAFLPPVIAPLLAHFQPSGCDFMLMWLRIAMKPAQCSLIASIIIKPSCQQSGLGLQHPKDLPWISTSALSAQIAPLAHLQQSGGDVYVDAAWCQGESCLALFPSLSHNHTKPDATWSVRVRGGGGPPRSLALDLFVCFVSPCCTSLCTFATSGRTF